MREKPGRLFDTASFVHQLFSLSPKRLHCRVWRILRYIEQVRGLPAAGGAAFSFSLAAFALCDHRISAHFVFFYIIFLTAAKIQRKLILHINKTFTREYVSDYRYDAAARYERESIQFTAQSRGAAEYKINFLFSLNSCSLRLIILSLAKLSVFLSLIF